MIMVKFKLSSEIFIDKKIHVYDDIEIYDILYIHYQVDGQREVGVKLRWNNHRGETGSK